MKTPFATCSKPTRFCGVALSLAVSLALCGVLVMPAAVVAATATPTENPVVDQQPLTVQPTVPPNITLMLDDSGSMQWNFMPDWSYLQNNNNNDAVINSANNGVWYNPTITYLPPPNADGTGTFTNETDMTNAPEDGYGVRTTKTFNLFTYDGSYDYNECGGGVCSGSDIDYNVQVTAPPVTTYHSVDDWHSSEYYCSNDYSNQSGHTGDYTWTAHSGSWTLDGQPESDGGECKYQYKTVTINHVNFFQYSTGPAAGPYAVYYVAQTAADCANHPTPTSPDTYGGCVGMDDTSGAGAPSGVSVSANVANWFAYYHTRILMAKTGLLTGFNKLNATYRVGFGSINGNNNGDLPSPTGTFGSNSNVIAEVQPFGDGSAGTQRASFWSWVEGEHANGSTPLRRSLQAVGDYYETEQPWNSTPGDPGYSTAAGATNSPIACRAAYTILTTDGFWNGSTPQSIGDQDGTAGPTVTGPNNRSYTYAPVLPYTDANLTQVPTIYDAVCDNKNATLDDPTGNCMWTEITYKKHSYSSTQQRSGTTCAEHSNYYSCTDSNGSYYGCNAGDTWNAAGQQCHGFKTSGDSVSDTLADVAMYFWKHDLQDGSGNSYNLANEVPTSTEDPAFWQHMTTFTMGLGFTPVGITPAGTTIDQIFKWANGGAAIANFSWPTPSSNSDNNIADLAHAAVNGHGGFFSATSPQAFTSGIESALKRVSERVGTGSSLAANSTSLQTGTVIYQAVYYTSLWKGDLKAFAVCTKVPCAPSTAFSPYATAGAIALTPSWSASSELPATGSRDIETYNPTTGKFVAFKNAASAPPDLSTAQLAALGSDTTTREAIVNYLRGDQSQEQSNAGGIYRTRESVLGDIVDSQPVYSGPPDPNEFVNQSFLGTTASASGDIPFYDWAVGTVSASTGKLVPSAASTRTPLLFVAGNDGMLHAFNASTGAEVYAYLPGAVITSGLADLANPDYGSDANPHQYFNDGQLTIADAYFAEGSAAAAWHTILVGTTGRGMAKTIYALDITDPANITPLWERSAGGASVTGDSTDATKYIGQMVGKPVIAQTNYVSGTSPKSTWSVLMGNGYNSAEGEAALLQFNLATGALSVHLTGDTTTGNGLAAPIVWMDNPGNGVSDIAYAGDLHGQVWSFALNDTTGANPTPTSTGAKLFTAKSATGKVQPITAGMLAGQDPTTGDVWLFFGTGQYLNTADLTNSDVQTWYGIIVQSATTPTLVTNLSNGRSALTERTITGQTAGSPDAKPPVLPARTVSAATSGDMSNKSGWYLDLTDPTTTTPQGERMVDANQFQGSVLIGVTRIPVVSDVCNPSGTGWLMALDPFTGSAPTGNFFDVNNDGFVNSGDEVSGSVAAGVGFTSIPNAPIFVGSAAELSLQNGGNATVGSGGSAGAASRVSWRELVNP